MDYETFLEIVEQEIGGSPDTAAKAARATLQTLGERIDRGLARRLAAELPPELAPWIATPTPAEKFDVDAFVSRAAIREGVDVAAAVRHVSAVFDGLARTLPGREWSALVSELPREFAALLPRGPYVPATDAGTFLEQVAARTGLDREAADRAIDAVLETLAERIAGGEVEDLIERLPIELHAPLRRGLVSVRGQPKPMRLDQFIHAVADREGVDIIDAALHTRAVFLALRDLVGEEEVRDITDQLPSDYVQVLTG